MWKRERYLVAKGESLANVDGITAKGLGMSIVRPHVIFAQAAITAIHHLGSGHLLCYVKGDFGIAARVAVDLISCGDWEFGGLEGWKNADPDLTLKVQAVLKKHARVAYVGDHAPDREQARKAARERA
jgi:hypothetical protein